MGSPEARGRDDSAQDSLEVNHPCLLRPSCACTRLIERCEDCETLASSPIPNYQTGLIPSGPPPAAPSFFSQELAHTHAPSSQDLVKSPSASENMLSFTALGSKALTTRAPAAARWASSAASKDQFKILVVGGGTSLYDASIIMAIRRRS